MQQQSRTGQQSKEHQHDADNLAENRQGNSTNGQGVWNNQTRQFEKKPYNRSSQGTYNNRDQPEANLKSQGQGSWNPDRQEERGNFKDADHINTNYYDNRSQNQNTSQNQRQGYQRDQRSRLNDHEPQSNNNRSSFQSRQGNHQERRPFEMQESSSVVEKREIRPHSQRSFEKQASGNNYSSNNYDRRDNPDKNQKNGNNFYQNNQSNPEQQRQAPMPKKDPAPHFSDERRDSRSDREMRDTNYRQEVRTGSTNEQGHLFKRDYGHRDNPLSGKSGFGSEQPYNRDGPENRFSNFPQRGGYHYNNNRYQNYGPRSPLGKRTRSRSSSPPRTSYHNNEGGNFRDHQGTQSHRGAYPNNAPYYNNRSNVYNNHRGGHHSGGYNNDRSHHPESGSQNRSLNGYYVPTSDGSKQFISKSDFHNPNNPKYLGGIDRKSDSRDQEPYQSRDSAGYQPSANLRSSPSHNHHRSPRLKSRSPKRSSQEVSEPRNQDHVRNQTKDLDTEIDRVTKKVSVAGSSPSRPNLEIVRRVPSSALSKSTEQQREITLQDEKQRERSPLRTTIDKHDKDSNMTYGSPKSDASRHGHDSKRMVVDKGNSRNTSPANGDKNKTSPNRESKRGSSQPSQVSYWSQKGGPPDDKLQNKGHSQSLQPQDNIDEADDDIPAFSGIEEIPRATRRSRSKSNEGSKKPQENFESAKIVDEEDNSRPIVEIEENEVQQKPSQRDDPKEEKLIYDHQGNIIDPEKNCNIYVAGIPRRTTEDSLRKIFSPFGSILNVHIIKDFNTKLPRGFAYLLYKNGKDANTAIQTMDQTSPFNDWKITVEHAKRGEIVTQEIIEKYQKNMVQKPYGSSSFGYDYSGGPNYNNRGRGSYQSYNNANSRGGGSYHQNNQRGAENMSRQDSYQDREYRDHHHQGHREGHGHYNNNHRDQGSYSNYNYHRDQGNHNNNYRSTVGNNSYGGAPAPYQSRQMDNDREPYHQGGYRGDRYHNHAGNNYHSNENNRGFMSHRNSSFRNTADTRDLGDRDRPHYGGAPNHYGESDRQTDRPPRFDNHHRPGQRENNFNQSDAEYQNERSGAQRYGGNQHHMFNRQGSGYNNNNRSDQHHGHHQGNGSHRPMVSHFAADRGPRMRSRSRSRSPTADTKR